MPSYNFKVPAGRGLQCVPQQLIGYPDCKLARDLFLYALFARVAATDNTTHEFETKYNPNNNTIELQIPQQYLDFITDIDIGPDMRSYLDWLIGRQGIIDEVLAAISAATPENLLFVSAGSIQVWSGATAGNNDDNSLTWILPSSTMSVIGTTRKSPSNWTGGKIKTYLIWRYNSGDVTAGSTLDLRCVMSATSLSEDLPRVRSSTDTQLSTTDTSGKIKETQIGELNTVVGGDIISIVIRRNWEGSPDPMTEVIDVIGIRLEPDPAFI